MKVLIVASYNKGRFAPFIEEQTVALQQLGCGIEWFGIQGKGLTGYLRAILSLRERIKVFKPDVIHAHYGLSCLAAGLSVRYVPVVSTYHGSDINNKIVRLFSKMAMRLSSWNIFVSQRNVDMIKPKKFWSLIPCGITLPLPWSELSKKTVNQQTLAQFVNDTLECGMKNVLFAGAYDNAVKDSKLAKDAVDKYNEQHKKKQIHLIELKGYRRDEVNALMYNCDALLMTSKTEGSPQVIKEAMACGCPIVSVDVGDVAERISGLDGCSVVSSRDPHVLASALEKAIEYNGKTKGRERILQMGLTNNQVAQTIREIYEQVTNGRSE